MEVLLRKRLGGVEFAVKATPSAKRNEIRGVFSGALKVHVTAAPEKGKANQAIIKLLSKELGVAKNQIELVSGGTSSLKKFVVAGMSEAVLESKLLRLLDE